MRLIKMQPTSVYSGAELCIANARQFVVIYIYVRFARICTNNNKSPLRKRKIYNFKCYCLHLVQA